MDDIVVFDTLRYHEGELVCSSSQAEVLESLESGKTLIFKGVFPREAMERIRRGCHAYSQHFEPSNPDVVPGVANFYRINNNPEKSKVKSIARNFSSFYWNDSDFGGETPYLKALGNFRNRLAGLEADYAYFGVVDEHLSVPKIVHYPAGGGYLQAHVDPPSKQKLVAIAILSELGADYSQGGVYVEEDDGSNRRMLDKYLRVGDVYIINPAVRHGVAPIDADHPLDFNDVRGRWMMFSTLVFHGSLFGQPTEGLKAFR